MNDHPSPEHALVVLQGLTKRFSLPGLLPARPRSGLTAVDHVSVAIARGETLGLVGESGSGKTTLGLLAVGLMAPTAGTVWFDGQELAALSGVAWRRLRRRIQIVFQDATQALNPRLRVGAALVEPMEVHGLARGARARELAASLLEEVGVGPEHLDRYPHQLSGGQRQRVGLARALALEPEFVVLDEPVANLDVSLAAQVLQLLVGLKRRRRLTYLLIGHHLAMVRQLADRVAVMYRGRLVESAPSADLYRAPLHPYTASLLAAIPVPEPGRKVRPLPLLASALPEDDSEPACRFQPRCTHPRKDRRCILERPPLRQIAPGRWAACHYAEDPVTPAPSAPHPSTGAPA
jgi:peptide/nickel transport system ATP-binding protein/oligopeptide transport system ATP-binding protein